MVSDTKIKIAFPTFIFFAVLLLWNPSIYSFLPFLAAFLHEMGHITVMKLCGQKIHKITVLPFGVDIKKAPSVSSYKNDIAVSCSGVGANLFLTLFCFFLPPSPEINFFSASNIVLAIVNILPIKTLDGGEIVEKTIAYIYGTETAEKVIGITSIISIMLIGALAIWILFSTSYNFSLLLMCIYLFCSIFLKKT